MTKMKAKKIEASQFESVFRKTILSKIRKFYVPVESDFDDIVNEIMQHVNNKEAFRETARITAESRIKVSGKRRQQAQEEFDEIKSKESLLEVLYETIEQILPKFNVEFDLENLECDNECDKNVGIQTVGDFSYWGGISGGDWEHPVYFILYIDENGDIAGYVPEEGNVYNKSENSAFGNNHESDVEAIFEQYGKKVKDDSYLNEDFDFDKIKEDIKNKIEIVGE